MDKAVAQEAGDDAFAIRCDVAAVAAMRTEAVNRFGGIDGAFNNVGIEYHGKMVSEIEGSEWSRVFYIDLNGMFFCLKQENRGGVAMIQTNWNRLNQLPVDAAIYALRNMVERCFNKLKNAPRMAT